MEKHKVMRVAHFPGSLAGGGVASVVMNLYRNIDKSSVQFDFYVSYGNINAGFKQYIESNGGNIYLIPQIKRVGVIKYFFLVKKKLKENGPYDYVHIHSIHMGVLPALSAKSANIKNIIFHSHNTQDPALSRYPFHKVIENFLRICVNNICDFRMACGRQAGLYSFGKHKNFFVLNNGIDLKRFYPYVDNERRILKEFYGIPLDKIIVGDIARFASVKNMNYFVDLAIQDRQKDDDCFFVLVGSGDLLDSVINNAKENKVYDKFLFAGLQNRVEDFYNMMDIFCLPSYFEGLPVCAVEAQACGLPTIVSNYVTEETDMGLGLFYHVQLSPTIWIEYIYKLKNKRICNKEKIRRVYSIRHYEISDVSNILCNIYCKHQI